MTKLALGLLALLTLACGTITTNLDTDVSAEGEVSHDIEIIVEGKIVEEAELDGEDLVGEDIPPECSFDLEGDRLRLACEGLSSEQLADDSDGFGTKVQFKQTETEQSTQYQVSMRTIFDGLMSDTGELDTSELIDDYGDLLDMTFNWNVTMPGKIVEAASNADSYDGRTARFESTWGQDDRQTLRVVSLVSKGGACSAR